MDADTKSGMDALMIFHNQSARYSGYQGRSFDDLLGAYGPVKAEIYAEGIGLTIRVNNMDWGDVREAMEGLADKAQGRIPKDAQEYIRYLGNEAAQINWLSAAGTVAVDVAVATAAGAQAVGDSVLTSLSWVTKILPFLVVGAVLFYVARLVGATSDLKNLAEKAGKRIKKAAAK